MMQFNPMKTYTKKDRQTFPLSFSIEYNFGHDIAHNKFQMPSCYDCPKTTKSKIKDQKCKIWHVDLVGQVNKVCQR